MRDERLVSAAAVSKEEWPRLRDGFDRWLAADNFGDGGRQRLSLRNLNAAS